MTGATSSVVQFTQPGVEFEPLAHRYTYEGQPVVNVTGILRTYRISADWSHVDQQTLMEKRDLGSAVHAATHYHDEGDLLAGSIAAPVEAYLEGWRQAVHDLELEILLVETLLVHPSKRYGGQLDRFAIAHALQRRDWGHLRPSVVDIKTGDPEDAGAGSQTAAYEESVRAVLDPFTLRRPDLESGWGDPWVRYSIRLLPTGRYSLHTYTSPRDGHRFNWALSLEASAHPSWRTRC